MHISEKRCTNRENLFYYMYPKTKEYRKVKRKLVKETYWLEANKGVKN